jgi:hypothetical protein
MKQIPIFVIAATMAVSVSVAMTFSAGADIRGRLKSARKPIFRYQFFRSLRRDWGFLDQAYATPATSARSALPSAKCCEIRRGARSEG